MSKTRVGTERFAMGMQSGAATASGTDRIGVEVETRLAQNGTYILVVDNAAGSDLANVEIWTSSTSDFLTAGTAGAETDSDNKVDIISDTAHFYAAGVYNAAISDVTVSSNTVTSLTEDGMYVFAVKKLRRYLNFQYDGDGTGGKVTTVFIGHDLLESPQAAARTAYS